VLVRVQCPQCRGYCQVQSEHLGAPVRCGGCRQVFTATAPPTAPPMRPLIAAPAKVSPVRPGSEAEMELELDGPAASAAVPPTAPEPLPPSGLRCDIGCATTPGRQRTRNEDSYLVQQLSWCNLDQRRHVALMVVADGMGGYEAGDRASGLVIRNVADSLAGLLGRALGAPKPPEARESAEAIANALQQANRVVVQQGQTDPNSKGMGATAVVVLAWDEVVQVGHVGDCRVYHSRAGQLTQVTRDQTLVARMVELGTLTPAEALVHPQRNEVTQAIGKHTQLLPATYPLRLQAGDWLLVACDGLHAHVNEMMLRTALLQAPESAGLLAQQLVDLANQHGGSDNCTVVALRCW
jgi:PPM family protein phosphatase